MASKFASQFSIPKEFPNVLQEFVLELLRVQPSDINEFATKYFDTMSSEIGPYSQMAAEGESMDDIEEIIYSLFAKYDEDQSGQLDSREFQTMMRDLQKRLNFPEDEIYRLLGEADMNEDGRIDYAEFTPLAMQIIQGILAKRNVEQMQSDTQQQAEDLLVHGMTREELDEMILSIFKRLDKDNSGVLNRAEFLEALSSVDLGLTRREMNNIFFRIDLDDDGNVNYEEFVPFAYDLLRKLTSMRLMDLEFENDQLAKLLLDALQAKDAQMTGELSPEDIRDVLHEAHVGLSRMQIYAVISAAQVSEHRMISYSTFVPVATECIRSMLSFEKGIQSSIRGTDTDAETRFFDRIEKAMPGAETCALASFMDAVAASPAVTERELAAAKLFLQQYGDEVPVEEAKARVWQLLKTMRCYR